MRKEVAPVTEINTDASGGVFAPAHVKLPDGAACPTAVRSGAPARVPSLTSGPAAGKGTGVPKVSVQTQIQPLHFGPKPIPNPYNYMTRASALGGGALGPHPAREPEPV
jgi:hypothetical protein